ncbi:hypothetical protein Col01nite_00600 [Cellulomonas oligotrophica]|uniref:Uncharacterized protein n=1 Tax=Cellulomonas oligotrophica TaxID=931536 RepID=A0ABQ4D5A1_9CELL|nr:hypothetical protein Col01nite_00600 [Cellulomonas oligotrophica]
MPRVDRSAVVGDERCLPDVAVVNAPEGPGKQAVVRERAPEHRASAAACGGAGR